MLLSELMSILPAGSFYAQLQASQKEPVYHGDTVKANDGGKVLMQWKVTEDTRTQIT